MTQSHGFTLLREENLSETGGQTRLWKHEKTGAQLLSVCNSDENKTFGVTFRTPPKNSTGVAHILEHSVLCGSKKYPVKEPFVELLKSSLQTFLNALTFPDKTCYPVASTNVQDFYNLIDVYLDAVFYPRIDRDVLRQEGWHIAVETAEDGQENWAFKGVVYNEMKGVYSSPDSVLMEEAQHAVFPNTLYSLDSGGNPDDILNLTYEEFRDFHARYYHPSNARFFFWGDDAEQERLACLEKLLAPFDFRAVDSAVPLQPFLNIERKVECAYAASPENMEGAAFDQDIEDDDSEESSETAVALEQQNSTPKAPHDSHCVVNWLLCPSSDTEQVFIFEMLEHILAGLPGSPLRKALMDSGLGEDITGGGLETDLQQCVFSIGLRSIQADKPDEVELLILDCLANLVEQGIDAKSIEAALNSLEFDLRENNTGRFPRGLQAMFRSLSTWLYDHDAFAPLAWEKPLANIKARLANGEKVFENTLETWFLNNTHRVNVVLLPDPTLAEKRSQHEADRLEALRSAMSPAEQIEVVATSARLRLAQEQPDSPEALASIPALALEDLAPLDSPLPSESLHKPNLRIFTHTLDTTGILYAKLLLSLDSVPLRLFPLLSLYTRALTEMGTAQRDFVELGLELAAKTGSLDAAPSLHSHIQSVRPLAFLDISGKAVTEKMHFLSQFMEEILLSPSFDHKDRFTQMVLEEKARLEQSLVPSGHSMVSVRLGGQLSQAGWLAECIGGVEYLHFVRDLVRRVEHDWPGVLADLHSLHACIVRREAAPVLNLTADQELLNAALPAFDALVQALPSHPLPAAEWTEQNLRRAFQSEALVVPAQVNYVGLGMNLHDAGYQFHGSASVVLRHIRMGYLWDRVRVQGGAYGCFANYNRATGAFSFLSYRDPNVERTLSIYRQCADYLGNLSLPRADIVRAVVGAIGDMDTYLLPGAKGTTSLWRQLTGESDRQRIRDEILSTSLDNFHAFAQPLATALAHSTACALGGPAVEEHAQKHDWKKIVLL